MEHSPRLCNQGSSLGPPVCGHGGLSKARENILRKYEEVRSCRFDSYLVSFCLCLSR